MAQKTAVAAEKFLRALLAEREIEVKRIVLFGSSAGSGRDKAKDIDLVVVSESFRGQDIFEIVEKTRGVHRELVRRFHRPFDLIFCSDFDWNEGRSLIVQSAKQTGAVLFES